MADRYQDIGYFILIGGISKNLETSEISHFENVLHPYQDSKQTGPKELIWPLQCVERLGSYIFYTSKFLSLLVCDTTFDSLVHKVKVPCFNPESRDCQTH